jgi:cysteine desulfurase
MAAYLDHAASTPLRPEALEAMLPFLRDQYANPSGAHTMARAARKAIDEARDTMAELLGFEPREIVFTGGGTEADNLAVLGRHDRVGGVVVASAIEHHAVLEPALARGGRLVAVDERGVLDLDALGRTLDELAAAGEQTTLVTVMLANNEVGTIQPLAEVATIVHATAADAVVHTDAVQAFAWLDVSAATASVDLLSVSAHKFGGPKGAGVLAIRERAADALAPRTLGGGQERERRSGTQDVAAIVGMAEAARLAAAERAATVERVGKLRDRLVESLVASVPDLTETGVGAAGERAPKVAGTAHVCIGGIESESLLFLLEQAEVYASAASSCASGAQEPSHVLAAMGIPRERAFGSLRLSLGAASTDADVDAALDAIPPAVERLRRFA